LVERIDRPADRSDPNRDEAIVDAQRLMEAGVAVEVPQWRGTFHGSQAVLTAEVSQRQIAEEAL
jgi:hypothetical protein